MIAKQYSARCCQDRHAAKKTRVLGDALVNAKISLPIFISVYGYEATATTRKNCIVASTLIVVDDGRAVGSQTSTASARPV